MRKIILTLTLVILLTTLASAEILITQQPNSLYNSRDTIQIPTKITTNEAVNGFFLMLLICSGKQTEMHREYITLTAGQEIEMNPTFPLTTGFVGKSVGTCKIKAMLGDDYLLTNNFQISNKVEITLTSAPNEVNPGESILIEGDSKKENGAFVEGFVEIKILKDGIENINLLDTVRNGQFSINISLPEDTAAGQSLVKINVYEKDIDDQITNTGFVDYNMKVAQIPTSVEVAFETSEVEPGTNVKIKAILHDQSGEPIAANAIISIKNSNEKILEQVEKETGELFEYPIAYNEAPSEWVVVAASNRLTGEATFKIIEKAEVKIELSNKTMIITNVGNVPYQGEVLVKIGEEPVNINVTLEVDESEKYVLTAPEGEYDVEIISEGESKITQQGVILTGSAIDLKKAGQGIVRIARNPLAWIFILFILAGVAFILWKKGYKKSFFGHISFKKKQKNSEPLEKNSLVQAHNPAQLSLSIKGSKQTASLICLRIKNLKELQSQKGNAEEIIQNVVNIAEEEKATVYENQGNLFFILAPLKTKTFKNERPAIELAQRIKKELDQHNKLAKQKIDFGISVNSGSIIAKQEDDKIKFMSLGTLITTSKKIAHISQGEILLGEKIKEKVMTEIKTEKEIKGKTPVYKIKEMKNKTANKKFISDFIHRLEGNKKKKD